MSLDSADVTTEGLNEVFGMVRDGFFSSDDAAEVWIGFVEGVDEGVVGTDGEMLADYWYLMVTVKAVLELWLVQLLWWLCW